MIVRVRKGEAADDLKFNTAAVYEDAYSLGHSKPNTDWRRPRKDALFLLSTSIKLTPTPCSQINQQPSRQ